MSDKSSAGSMDNAQSPSKGAQNSSKSGFLTSGIFTALQVVVLSLVVAGICVQQFVPKKGNAGFVWEPAYECSYAGFTDAAKLCVELDQSYMDCTNKCNSTEWYSAYNSVLTLYNDGHYDETHLLYKTQEVMNSYIECTQHQCPTLVSQLSTDCINQSVSTTYYGLTEWEGCATESLYSTCLSNVTADYSPFWGWSNQSECLHNYSIHRVLVQNCRGLSGEDLVSCASSVLYARSVLTCDPSGKALGSECQSEIEHLYNYDTDDFVQCLTAYTNDGDGTACPGGQLKSLSKSCYTLWGFKLSCGSSSYSSKGSSAFGCSKRNGSMTAAGAFGIISALVACAGVVLGVLLLLNLFAQPVLLIVVPAVGVVTLLVAWALVASVSDSKCDDEWNKFKESHKLGAGFILLIVGWVLEVASCVFAVVMKLL